MNILFVGKARLEFGGPSLVMSNLKKKININKFDNVEILDIDKFDIKTIFEILFFKKFENYLFKFDLVHFHELWSPYIILFAYKSQRLGIPYFFTFHGVLNKWSLKKNNILKKFFLKIFSKYIFKISHAFHFLNKKEFDEVKILSKYFNSKSFVLKNGIEIENKILKKNFTNKNDIIDLLYFGRIHPKKGIIDLINMFKIIKKNKLKINLKIVGPDTQYKKYLVSEINKYELSDYITFSDPIYSINDKIKLFSKSKYFILPSYDEADSMALKESLSYGVPIIITRDCKFENPENFNIGYMIEHDHNKIYEKIKIIFEKRGNYNEMSDKCHEFAKNNFDLNIISNNYIELTKEIVSGAKYSDNWL